MAQRCPSCGAEVPPETGQHALAPVADLVECPSCGAKVTLEPETGGGEGEEEFAGSETVEGVMEELREKEGGPE